MNAPNQTYSTYSLDIRDDQVAIYNNLENNNTIYVDNISEFRFNDTAQSIEIQRDSCLAAYLSGDITTQCKLEMYNRLELLDNAYLNVKPSTIYLSKSRQFVIASPLLYGDGQTEALFEIVDFNKRLLRVLTLPFDVPLKSILVKDKSIIISRNFSALDFLKLDELPNGNLIAVDSRGACRVIQTKKEETVLDMKKWKSIVGVMDVPLNIYRNNVRININDLDQVEMSSDNGNSQDTAESKTEGNMEDTAKGSGGSALKQQYRQEARKSGNIDSSFKLRTQTSQQPQLITETLREMHDLAMKKRAMQLEMTSMDMESFQKYSNSIQRQVTELKVILESIKQKENERVWISRQTTGDLDDSRLIEGVTGEKSVYKRRGELNDEPGMQMKAKRLLFVFDLSASMMRFNSHDGRLDRSLECALSFPC